MDDKELRDIFQEKAAHMQKEFHRLTSFGDLIVDRWEKARLLGFGEGSSVYDSSLALGDVKVGKNTWIGPGTVLDGARSPLSIGSYCSISTGVQIYTHNSIKWSLTGGNSSMETAPVNIDDNVYIGPNSIISCGVEIGPQCIVGAQSLVNHSLPACSIAWGQPARLVTLG